MLLHSAVSATTGSTTGGGRGLLLLAAQGRRGVEARGPPGRQPAREDGRGGEEQRHGGEDGQVGGADAVEQAGEEAGEGEGAGEARRDAESRRAQALAERQAQDLGPAGAEGGADADLARAPLDGVGGD